MELNLPAFEPKLRKQQGNLDIFDDIRKKYLRLTPEEWVRQHFINYLITELKYPKSLVSLEDGLQYNQLLKRSDIRVFDRKGNLFLLVECKAPTVAISETTFQQISNYQATLKAPYLALTNGLIHWYFSINSTTGLPLLIDKLPIFEG